MLLLRSTYCSFNYFCCRCFYCCCCFRLKSMCLIVEPCLMATAAIRDSNPTQLEGKVSWLLSLEWSNVGRGAIITGIHHHPVTRVNNISSIGICLHLRTIHQVVATIQRANHIHSIMPIVMWYHSPVKMSEETRGLRAPIRKIIAWHLNATHH